MPKNSKKHFLPVSEVKPRTYWQRFLETSGGAALISIVLGGLMSGLINAATPNDNGSRESEIKTREIQVAAYKEYLDQQRDIVFHASELIGRCASTSDGLVALTDPVFDPSQYTGLEPQRLEMKKKFNECATQWNAEYNKLSFAISYYHGGQPAVVEAWADLQQATTGVMECSQRWYVTHSTSPVATDGVCKAQKDELTKRLDAFNRQVSAARQYMWQEWRASAPPAAEGANKGGRKGLVGLVEQ